MKKLFLFTSLAFALVTMTNCTRIGVGEVGIEVSMSGSSRGVQDIPVRTGWAWYFPIGTSIIEYPTYIQTAVWTHSKDEGKDVNEEISFNSKDGLVFFADVNLSYRLEGSKAPYFYVKYKAEDINSFTHGIMRQVARDEFNNLGSLYTAEELYGVKKEEFVQRVRAKLNDTFKDVGPYC